MWKFQESWLKHVQSAWQGVPCQTACWTGHVKVYANQLCLKISFLQTSKQMSFMLSV